MSSFNTVKVEFASQLRRLAFDSSASSWSAVRAQILNSYNIVDQDAVQFAFHYLDEEGDLISVNSDTEFAEAIRCAAQKKKILKFILSKIEKPIVPVSATASNQESAVVDEVKEPLLKLAVDGHSDEAEIGVESVDDGADQQEEEMDLPLDRRDLLSRSPTLSEASDSSFVSINAQSLRDDLDEKEDEHVVKTVEESQPVKVVAADEDGKASAPIASVSAVSTPKQPEFISTDRAVVHDVMKQLAEDMIELKAETPKAVPNSPPAQATNDNLVEPVCAPVTPVPALKVKDLRSVVEGVINERFLAWIDDLLTAVDNLDHAEEDVKRVHQLTTHIRLGLVNVADNRQYVQRISDGVAKKMMRIMKQAEGKQCRAKKEKQQTKDEEEKKAGPRTTPVPTQILTNTSSSINSVDATSIPSTHACTATSASSSSCVAAVAPAIHYGITCDGCGLSPIRGVRFHCLTCDQIDSVRNAGGFDLCEGCESRAVHQQVDGKSHVLLKFKQATKFIVDVEVPAGPIVGQQVYDVLRVNEDGSRTPFATPQTVIAVPTPKPAMPNSVSKDEKKEDMNVNALGKVAELESRIRALENIIKVDAEKKAEKRAEKQQLRKEKEERKKLKEEAAAKAKAAKAETKQKLKEAKAAAKAATAAKKEEAKKAAQLTKAKKEHNDEKIEQKEQSKKEANIVNVPDSVANEQTQQQSRNEVASSSVLSAVPPTMNASMSNASTSSSTSASVAPFAFTLPQFPFSDMVNSITSTVSNTLTATPFSFSSIPNANTKPSAPSQPEATTQTIATGTASSSSVPSLSASSSSDTVSATSTWSLATVSAKPSLASVRAPAFFPYMQQLRDLEAMGFDVDKSIHALRFYRGDMQKAINSML